MKRTAFLLLMVGLSFGVFAQQSLPEVLLRTSGSLASGDTVSPDGDFQDTYSVTAPDTGRLEIVAVSPDFVPRVTVRVPGDGDRMTGGSSNAARASVPVTAGARVSVAISGVSSQRVGGARRYADYMLAVSFSQGGGDLMVGTTIDGELSIDDESSDDGAYIDWYDVALDPGQRDRVVLSSDDFDAYLRVELPDGRSLENDDVDGTNSGLTFNTGDGGMARVGVTSFDYQAAGTYSLSMESVQQARIEVGQTISDYFNDDSLDYVLTGSPGESVRIDLQSNDFDTYLEVADPDGTYLNNDDVGGATDSRLTYQFGDSGEATITISSFDDATGAFTLSVMPFTYDGPVIEDGYRLHDGEVVDAQLRPGLPSPFGSPAQRFTFQGGSGERVEIILSSDEIDSYLTVEAPSGNTFTDDDSGGGYDSKLSMILDESGVYNVYASDLDNGSTGSYSVSFRTLGAAKMIYQASGELTSDDQTDITGKYYDLHTFTVQRGSNVVVDVTSDEFDAYAVVRTASGQILFRDDDTAGNSNPRIEFTADRTEELQLVVTAYDPESTGAYQVSVYE